MNHLEEVEKQAEIALARLGVAEDFGWALAALTGIGAHLRWDTGWWSVPIVLATYYLVTFSYRRKENQSRLSVQRVRDSTEARKTASDSDARFAGQPK